MLRDRSPLSIGSVAVAFETVCPTRLDLLHPHYRRLCRVLVDVDEWGQVNLLELLIRYARTMLPRPTTSHDSPGEEKEEVDPDLELLLTSAEPLFRSRNPAVSGRESLVPAMGDSDKKIFPLSGRDVGDPRVLLPCSAVTAPQGGPPITPTSSSLARGRTRRANLHPLHFAHRPGTSLYHSELIRSFNVLAALVLPTLYPFCRSRRR